jgi:hypothetical protein
MQAKSKESASHAQDNDTLVINIKRQHLDSNAQQVTAAKKNWLYCAFNENLFYI